MSTNNSDIGNNQRNILDSLPAYREMRYGMNYDRYHTLYPIDLIFESVHPDDFEQFFTVSVFSPTGLGNCTFNKKEVMELFCPRCLHSHDYFVLFYIIHGEMYQIIENKRHLYPEGSLCLINRNIRHREEYSTDFRAVFLSISVPLIQHIFEDSKYFFFPLDNAMNNPEIVNFFTHNLHEDNTSLYEYMDFIPNPKNSSVKSNMYNLFDRLTNLFLFPGPGSTYMIKGLLLQIFSALVDPENYQTIPINLGSLKEVRIFDRINAIFTETHGRASRKELEQSLNYSGTYLNNIVKKYSGLNIFQYGTSICMKEAATLLSQTTKSIAEITESLGFTNSTHFYKLFKDAYGTTPKKYRAMKQRHLHASPESPMDNV